MNTTGSTAASSRCRFYNRQIPNLQVPAFIVTLGTPVSKCNSKMRSLRRRCTLPSVRGCSARIGGVTSSGGWKICGLIGPGALCKPGRRSLTSPIHSYIGSVNNWAKAVLLWNIALDGNGQPLLPGTSSCKNPSCRGVVTINGGSYTLNEECEPMLVHRLCHELKPFGS